MAVVSALRLVGNQAIDSWEDRGAVLANLRVEDVALPEPREGELLAEPLCVGVCGSDNGAAAGKPNFQWVPRPRTIGHECSARVVALGKGTDQVTDLRSGDHVCVVPMLGCGDNRCRGCGRGRPNYCRRKSIFGFHRDGAFATQMVVEAARCLRVRDDLTPQQAACIEPLSVVAQAIHRKCTIEPGMDVVVSGCGIIGMMAAELARAAGARVAVTGAKRDRDTRLKTVASRGFLAIEVSQQRPLHEQLRTGLVDPDGRPFGDEYEEGTVDLLIECSGAPQALAEAGLSVQLEGSICVIATYPDTVSLDATRFTRAGQVLTGVMGSDREDFKRAQELLADGSFPVEPYAQLYPFEHIEQAMFDSMTARTTKAIVQVNR